MRRQKVTFRNKNNQELTGRLEFPVDQQPHNYVVFAHCFTCSKNLSAVKNISEALTNKGFGVLRFDFTGLGESEGDFEDTNFSGNVEDLIAASTYLENHYMAPSLLVGHSLGGAAVIIAASKLPSVIAVATISAPSNPKHVSHLLKEHVDEIKSTGSATVDLGGRPFTIKKQFLDDLESNSLSTIIKDLRKAILIFHSPQDETVNIKNAEELYKAAHHPKSFVTLDGADHLLSNSNDSKYVGNVIAEWASRYLIKTSEIALKTSHQVVASLANDADFTTEMKVGNHYMRADEPKEYGGQDFGPSPYEFVSAGLSACTAMTIQMYAKRKGWDVKNVEVHTSYGKNHAQDCMDCEMESAKIDTFERGIRLEGELDEDQLKRILNIANKCPVHKTLHSETQVITKLI